MFERRLEDAMPPQQAAEARRVRMMRSAQDFHKRHTERQRALRDYQERRLVEAIQSPRLENVIVAEAALKHLISEKHVPEDYSIDSLAQAVLYLMALDDAMARLIADILERWVLLSHFGGMQKAQL
jgi:hypothetical protein